MLEQMLIISVSLMFSEITYTAICRIVMIDQLNFVLVISFFNDIIYVDKINIYSKIFIVDDTIPELTLLHKLFHLHLLFLWLFEMLLSVYKPHFIS